MNNLALTAALATAPSAAFAELRERPRFLFPLLVVVACIVGTTCWYYSAVDIDWFKEMFFASNPDFQKMPEDQRAAAMSMMGRTPLLWSSVIGAGLGIPAIFAIQALYFLLAAKVTKMTQGFKHWFSLVCWTAMPIVISTVVAVILMLMRDNDQITPSILQPLSLNELLMQRPMGAPGYAWLEAMHIPGILGWILAIVGVRTWSQRSWGFASVVVLLPVVAVYGIWALFAFK
jgi:hypothetical protein